MGSALRNTLKSLCCGHGWSYAIFWRFDPRNSSLLTVEDAYYEGPLEEEIANMLPQVHLLGEGIVGQAAFTGKPRWMLSDAQNEECNLTRVIEGQDICKDNSELRQLFSSGIKTIAVISIKPWGVVQFGSTQKILERGEFLEQTQRLLMGTDDVNMLDASANTILPLDCENYDLDGLLASSISSENLYYWNLSSAHGDNSKELLRNVYSFPNLDVSFPSISKIHEEGMTRLLGESSCLSDQLTAAPDAQAVLSDRASVDVFLKPDSSMNNLIARNPCFGTWSGEVSSLASSRQQLVSEIRAQDVADVCSSEANASASSKLTVQDSLTSLCSLNRLFGPGGTLQDELGNSQDNQFSAQSSIMTEVSFPENFSKLHGLSKNLKPAEVSGDNTEFCSVDDLCQWFAPSPEHSICGRVTALDNSLSQSIEFNPTSVVVGSGAFPVKSPAVQNSITATVNSDGQETSALVHGSENSLGDSMGLDLSCDQAGECWGNILAPVVKDASDAGSSECISELNIGTLSGTRKGLFSDLGIEELLSTIENSNSFNKSSFEDQISTTKRQRTEYSPVNSNSMQLGSLGSSAARIDLVEPVFNLDQTNNLVHKKEIFQKSQVGLWIDDSHCINSGRAVPARPQKPEEPTKATRKRPRPGESTRPRPKDRQQIQDRIKELRGIIPNGGKCSIDSLLDRTIKYMLFLQSITKYADNLQEPNDPKLIDQANGVVLKDKTVGDSKDGDGVTWVFEVAGQTMVCPIIVEDMSPPGQMLIEMLCEEQGFFLEIADIIRGFGLNILKGKMEIREDKLWARFIVEGSRHVTRIDVLWSLVQLLQQTSTFGIDSANTACNVFDAGIPPLDNYQKTEMPLPLVMTNTLG